MFKYFQNFFEFQSKSGKILKTISVLPYIHRIRKLEQFLVQNQWAGGIIFPFSNVAGKMLSKFLVFFPHGQSNVTSAAKPQTCLISLRVGSELTQMSPFITWNFVSNTSWIVIPFSILNSVRSSTQNFLLIFNISYSTYKFFQKNKIFSKKYFQLHF